MKKTFSLMAAAGAMFVASAASADFAGVSVEQVSNPDWVANGYAGFTTYRVYVNFTSDADMMTSVFGAPGLPLSMNSSDGSFYNSSGPGLASNFAPDDFTAPPFNLWDNQWDTYVSLDATMASGNVTSYAPSGAAIGADTSDLAGNFTLTNHSWFVTPDDQDSSGQGIAGSDMRVMIAQLTVAEGEDVFGTINIALRDGTQLTGLEFTSIPAPGALALLGLAGLASRRRRA